MGGRWFAAREKGTPKVLLKRIQSTCQLLYSGVWGWNRCGKAYLYEAATKKLHFLMILMLTVFAVVTNFLFLSGLFLR